MLQLNSQLIFNIIIINTLTGRHHQARTPRDRLWANNSPLIISTTGHIPLNSKLLSLQPAILHIMPLQLRTPLLMPGQLGMPLPLLIRGIQLIRHLAQPVSPLTSTRTTKFTRLVIHQQQVHTQQVQIQG